MTRVTYTVCGPYGSVVGYPTLASASRALGTDRLGWIEKATSTYETEIVQPPQMTFAEYDKARLVEKRREDAQRAAQRYSRPANAVTA